MWRERVAHFYSKYMATADAERANQLAVVEAGSMARAAEALGLTSSGVGRAIGRLERGSVCGSLSALHAP
jgi:hypothetical protein